jgi:hypothetical protein
VNPALGAHLDGGGLDARLLHPRDEGVQLGRLGRREPGDAALAADPALGGGAEAVRHLEQVEQPGEEVAGGGLAVRAGDAEQQRVVLPGAVDRRGELAEQRAGLGRRDHGHLDGELAVRRVREHGDGAARQGVGDVVGAVAADALQRDEEVSGTDGGGAEADAAHGDVAGVAHEVEAGDEVGERNRMGRLGHERGRDRGRHDRTTVGGELAGAPTPGRGGAPPEGARARRPRPVERIQPRRSGGGASRNAERAGSLRIRPFRAVVGTT